MLVVQRQKQRHQHDQILLHHIGLIQIIKYAQRICFDKTVYSRRDPGQSQIDFSPLRLARVPPYQGEHEHDKRHEQHQKTAPNIRDTAPHEPDHDHVPRFDLNRSKLCRRAGIGRDQLDPQFAALKVGRHVHIVIAAASRLIRCRIQSVLKEDFPVQQDADSRPRGGENQCHTGKVVRQCALKDKHFPARAIRQIYRLRSA